MKCIENVVDIDVFKQFTFQVIDKEYLIAPFKHVQHDHLLGTVCFILEYKHHLPLSVSLNNAKT